MSCTNCQCNKCKMARESKKAYDWNDDSPPEEYFEAYNSFFKNLNATLLAPEGREVKGSLSWDLYQNLIGYEQSSEERMTSMLVSINSFQKKLAKEVRTFNKVAEKIKSQQSKMASYITDIEDAVDKCAMHWNADADFDLVESRKGLGYTLESRIDFTIKGDVSDIYSDSDQIGIGNWDFLVSDNERKAEKECIEKIVEDLEEEMGEPFTYNFKQTNMVHEPEYGNGIFYFTITFSPMSYGKTAGAIDLSHNGELAILLLSYFCDEFGFTGMQMSKFITKAYKQIKSDIKYAQIASSFGERIDIPFGGYYPTRKGLEECLRNMSAKNFGILVMDTGRKPTLAGTDC